MKYFEEWGAVEEDCDRKWTYDARVMLINEIRARPAFWVTSQRGKRRNPYLRQLRSEVAQRVSTKFGFKVTCRQPFQLHLFYDHLADISTNAPIVQGFGLILHLDCLIITAN